MMELVRRQQQDQQHQQLLKQESPFNRERQQQQPIVHDNNNNDDDKNASSNISGSYITRMVKDSIRWRKNNRRTNASIDPFMLPRGIVSGDEDDLEVGRGNGDSDQENASRSLLSGAGGDRFLLGRDLPLSPRQALSLWMCWRNYCGVRVIATLAMISSALSMQVMHNALVTTASLLCIGSAVVLLLQQRILKLLGPLRQQNNELRKNVHYMKQERERLHRSLDRMDETIVELQHIPKQLDQIASEQQVDVDRLVHVIQEQKEIHEKMRNKINQQVIQSILSIVVRSDRDGNWTLKPTEVEILIVRLGLVEGVVFHEKRFREVVQADQPPTISTVMKVIRSLLERDDEYQHPPSIFELKPGI